jgi:phage/plasmid-associated DNA primase
MDGVGWWSQSGELPGLLNWSLAGLRRLRSNGFTKAKAVKAAGDEHRTHSNPAAQFFAECCGLHDDGSASCSEVYRAYRAWSEARGYRPACEAVFGKEVPRHFQGVTRDRRSEGGRRQYVYVGLRLLVSATEAAGLP